MSTNSHYLYLSLNQITCQNNYNQKLNFNSMNINSDNGTLFTPDMMVKQS